MEKEFNGKALYHPSGKAGEYAYWACNFYKGCSNRCTYCFLKKGVMKPTLGGDVPTLKECFKNEQDALKTFERELIINHADVMEHGILFSFTTDVMLPETIVLTQKAVHICIRYGVPVKILTKMSGWEMSVIDDPVVYCNQGMVAIGYTLTGHDELEPGASPNYKRITGLKRLHSAGFKTFTSIEPIIDFASSLRMIREIKGFCDLYKIGLQSGQKYDKDEMINFILEVVSCLKNTPSRIYFKDSLISKAGLHRESLPAICVTRDYNMFKNT